jgi:hypothetical protein
LGAVRYAAALMDFFVLASGMVELVGCGIEVIWNDYSPELLYHLYVSEGTLEMS